MARMTNTLPDLRVIIAESMEVLADARLAQGRRSDRADLHGESTRWWSAKRGAETLRWCARYEVDREAPDLIAEIQRLEDILSEIGELTEPKAADYRAGVAKALESW
jgi:hypothetical protein